MLRAACLVLVLAVVSACRSETRADVEASAALDRSRELDARRELRARVAREIAAARRHLEQDVPAGALPLRARCADDALVGHVAQNGSLVVRARDVRRERRELLPLEFSASLAADHFAGVIPHLVSGRAALWDTDRAEPRNEAAGAAALEALAQLRGRRYRAELQVEAFSAPRVFRRKDAPRSEWAPGLLEGRLVIADLLEQTVLCEARLLVRGDADEAPVSRRLRESTRKKLLEALADRVWDEMGRSLAALSSVLRLPPARDRGAAEHHWARAPDAALAAR